MSGRPSLHALVIVSVFGGVTAALLGASACANGGNADFSNLGGAGGNGAGGDGATTDAVTSTHTTSVSSTHAASTTTVTSSTDATTTDTSTSEMSSSSTGAPCTDQGFEPNNSEQTAFNLGNISDSDGDGSTKNGTISSQGDADWFKYHGDDTSFHSVDPTVSMSGGAGLRLCTFFQCDSADGDANFSCPGGTTATTSPEARPGCCNTGDEFTVDFKCGSSSVNSDDATVFIRVDSPTNQVCVNYTIKWHY